MKVTAKSQHISGDDPNKELREAAEHAERQDEKNFERSLNGLEPEDE